MMFWVAVFGILLNVVGYGWQCGAIVAKKSGKSVSVPAFFSMLASSLVTVIYGAAHNDRFFTNNAWVCGVGQTLLLILAFQHKTIKWWEKLLCLVLALSVATTVISPAKGFMLLAVNALGAIYLWAQPAELLFGRKKGVLQLVTMICFEISGICWTVYSFHFGYSAAAWSYFGFCGYQLVVIALWWRAKE